MVRWRLPETHDLMLQHWRPAFTPLAGLTANSQHPTANNSQQQPTLCGITRGFGMVALACRRSLSGVLAPMQDINALSTYF